MRIIYAFLLARSTWTKIGGVSSPPYAPPTCHLVLGPSGTQREGVPLASAPLTRCVRPENLPAGLPCGATPFFFATCTAKPGSSVCLDSSQPLHQAYEIQSVTHIAAQNHLARGRRLLTLYQSMLALERMGIYVRPVSPLPARLASHTPLCGDPGSSLCL